jgi:hypothetical protein
LSGDQQNVSIRLLWKLFLVFSFQFSVRLH